ncbi:hypothetical protein E4P35_14145 [Thiopseudomonas sp. 4R-3cl]|nr:hypothetical protein E4P35_14145 [Thiopseudomonas sp. 4R-3cl]
MADTNNQHVDVEVNDVEQPEKELSLAEAYLGKIQEITGCTDEQAGDLANLTAAIINDAVSAVFNDNDTLRAMFTAMMEIQVNTNKRMLRLQEELEKRDFVVIDEEHHYSDLRVTYESEEPHSWIFERRIDGEWKHMELSESARTNLEVLCGKFFDGRTGRVGYVIDARALEADQE